MDVEKGMLSFAAPMPATLQQESCGEIKRLRGAFSMEWATGPYRNLLLAIQGFSGVAACVRFRAHARIAEPVLMHSR